MGPRPESSSASPAHWWVKPCPKVSECMYGPGDPGAGLFGLLVPKAGVRASDDPLLSRTGLRSLAIGAWGFRA